MLRRTFLISHFELFGLCQVVNRLLGKPMPQPQLKTPLFYKWCAIRSIAALSSASRRRR